MDTEQNLQKIRELYEANYDRMTPRTRMVMELRFGINDGVARTRKEVADMLGTSAERIRQIEYTALRPRVHLKRSKRLADFLE